MDVRLIRQKDTGESRGFAFVDFTVQEAEGNDIGLAEGGAASAKRSSGGGAAKKPAAAPKPKKAKGPQMFADDHLFLPTRDPKNTPFGLAFDRYKAKSGGK